MQRKLFRSNDPARLPSGFTLIELLVVIAIISILVALIMPAVQAAREAARRVQCSNNLKQMGIAMHNYHDVHKSFPPGAVWYRPRTNWYDALYRTTWGISLLPFLDEQNLASRYDHEADNSGPENKFVREQYVPVYACPTDINGAHGLAIPETYAAVGSRYQFGSYRGMGGYSDLSHILRPDQGRWNNYMGWRSLPRKWKGVFHIVCPGLTECESFRTVCDGASNTIAIGERHRPTDSPPFSWIDAERLATFWAEPKYSIGTATPFSETLRARRFYDCLNALPSSKPCQDAWASYHPGGINWLMCDGSVHFLSTSINIDLFCKLATIAGGEQAQLP